MLFRRIRDHVRRHDWFAVGIDLAVVIVGIYRGVQVAAWDENRRLLAQHEDYLSRLVDDLRDDVEEAGIVDRINRLGAQRIDWIEEFLQGGSPTLERDFQMQDFFSLTNTRRIILRRNTFDEMQSSGKFGPLVDDPELRNDLVEYYSDRVVRDQFNVIVVASENRFRERFAGVLTSDQMLGNLYEEFKGQVAYDFPQRSTDPSEVVKVIEKMQSMPQLLDALPDLKNAKVMRMREGNIVRMRAEKLIDRIEEEVARL